MEMDSKLKDLARAFIDDAVGLVNSLKERITIDIYSDININWLVDCIHAEYWLFHEKKQSGSVTVYSCADESTIDRIEIETRGGDDATF